MIENLPMIDLKQALQELDGVFHDEKQFQLELAITLQNLLEGSQGTVRVEWVSQSGDEIDLVVRSQESVIPIELKYKTKAAGVHDERFNQEYSISRHGDYDVGMYGFIKDITRIENIAEEHSTEGYAIFLTNDPNYWREGGRTATYDPFRINDGRTISGTIDWTEERGWQKSHNIEKPLRLDYEYNLDWLDYSYHPQISVNGPDTFRVLPVRIPPK